MLVTVFSRMTSLEIVGGHRKLHTLQLTQLGNWVGGQNQRSSGNVKRLSIGTSVQCKWATVLRSYKDTKYKKLLIQGKKEYWYLHISPDLSNLSIICTLDILVHFSHSHIQMLVIYLPGIKIWFKSHPNLSTLVYEPLPVICCSVMYIVYTNLQTFYSHPLMHFHSVTLFTVVCYFNISPLVSHTYPTNRLTSIVDGDT